MPTDCARQQRKQRCRAAYAYAETLLLVDEQSLFGSGRGYIDAHLLAAARLTDDAFLWTRDRRLHAVAERLSLSASPWH